MFLFIAGNESCPQPQTSEHLAAIEIMKLKHMIILQNKIDLVKETQAKEQHEQILRFVKGKYVNLKNIIVFIFKYSSNLLTLGLTRLYKTQSRLKTGLLGFFLQAWVN